MARWRYTRRASWNWFLKHGLDETSKSLSLESINHPTEKDLCPDPATLRRTQGMAGEFIGCRPELDQFSGNQVRNLEKRWFGAFLGRRTFWNIVRVVWCRLWKHFNPISKWDNCVIGRQCGVVEKLQARHSSRINLRSRSLSSCVGIPDCGRFASKFTGVGVTLSTPLLLVDNKSALILAICGLSWRSWYLAVQRGFPMR